MCVLFWRKLNNITYSKKMLLFFYGSKRIFNKRKILIGKTLGSHRASYFVQCNQTNMFTKKTVGLEVL